MSTYKNNLFTEALALLEQVIEFCEEVKTVEQATESLTGKEAMAFTDVIDRCDYITSMMVFGNFDDDGEED